MVQICSIGSAYNRGPKFGSPKFQDKRNYLHLSIEPIVFLSSAMVSEKMFKIHSNHSCSKVKKWKLKLGIQNCYCATLSWKSIKPQDNPATFSGWSGHFLDRPETFQIVWKLSRSYRHSFRSSKLSLDYPDTFPNYPDTFRIIQKTFLITPAHF